MIVEKDRINYLIDKYTKLLNSDRNKRLRSYWIEKPNSFSVNAYRCDQPKSYKEIGTIPVLTQPVESFFVSLLNYSLIDYYHSPEVYIEKLLEQRINQFNWLLDDAPLRPNLGIFLGSYYEVSLFGVETIFSKDHAAMPGERPIINDIYDLEKFSKINFENAGLVPLAIKLYEGINRYFEGTELKINFPCFTRGPFGILLILMGYDKLLTYMIDKPDFIKKALEIITDNFIEYGKWIEKEYNGSIESIPLFNDDVNCPTLSPSLYKELVLPEEKRIKKFYKKISYWHSCGDCTKLVSAINELKPEVINVSAFGELDNYAKEFKNDVAYEICVNPVKDVLNDDYIRKSLKIDHIINTCKINNIEAFNIMASALEGTGKNNMLGDIRNILEWISIARDKVNNFVKQEEKS